MKINDYVRTKNGNIRKINEIIKNRYEDMPNIFTDKVLIDIQNNKMEQTIYMENLLFGEDILKSSPNIIDLIEVGDYVNGNRVDFTNSNNKLSYEDKCIGFYDGDGDITLFEKDIKSIVTKEQFEAMEYKINE